MPSAMQAKKVAAGKKSAAKKSGFRIGDTIQSLTEKVRKELSKRIKIPRGKAKARTVDFAIAVIKLQQSAFDSTFKLLTRVQERGDRLVKDHVEEAAWLPGEGRDIVKEWSRTLNDGRAEFQKTVDKSYDLLRDYFERVRKEQKGAPKTAAASAVAAKKKPAAKKKAAPKKPMTNM